MIMMMFMILMMMMPWCWMLYDDDDNVKDDDDDDDDDTGAGHAVWGDTGGSGDIRDPQSVQQTVSQQKQLLLA